MVAALSFVEVNSTGASPVVLGTKFGFTVPLGRSGAYGETGSPVLLQITKATISIDPSGNGFGPIQDFVTQGGYPIMTLLHEEGHAIGLGHAGPYNGTVNVADLGDLATNFGQSLAGGSAVAGSASLAASAASAAVAAVPEPTTLALIGIGAIGLLGRRTRKANRKPDTSKVIVE